MPIESCGSRGFRWGKNGHCYDGPSRSLNRKKAIDQGLAITGGGKEFKNEMSKSELTTNDLIYLKSILKNINDKQSFFIDRVRSVMQKKENSGKKD